MHLLFYMRNIYISLSQRIFDFHIILRKNRDYFFTRNWLIHPCNEEWECLVWDRHSIITYLLYENGLQGFKREIKLKLYSFLI
jgi:hypothetical protein